MANIASKIPADYLHFSPMPAMQALRPLLPYPDQLTRPIKLGSVFWPSGATRWGMGHFLATEGQLADIREVVYPVLNSEGDANSAPGASTLVLDDGTETVSIANMYMLPPRPLFQNPFKISQTDDPNDLVQWKLPRGEKWLAESPTDPNSQAEPLYLLSFVDQRWFWWQTPSTVSIRDASTTWGGLITQIAGAISKFGSSTITTPSIPTAYLTPPAIFRTMQHYLPLLFDHAAFAIGMRVVVDWETGDVSLQNASDAIQSVEDQLTAEATDGTPVREGGGLYAFGNQADQSDGQVIDSTIYLPASVDVVFVSTSIVEVPKPAHKENVALADLDIDYPPDSFASNVETIEGTGIVQSPQMATYTSDTIGSDVPDNKTALAALATQAAGDWYLWQLGKMDVMYAGLVGWVPEGLNDIEWNPDSTRITRGSFHASIPPAEGSMGGGGSSGGGGIDINSKLLPQWIKYTSLTPSGTDTHSNNTYPGIRYDRDFVILENPIVVADANNNNGDPGIFYMALYDPVLDVWYTNLFVALVDINCVAGAIVKSFGVV